MVFMARTEGGYMAVETDDAAERPRRLFASRVVLLIEVVALAALLGSLCAISGTRTRGLRAKVNAAVVLDGQGSARLPSKDAALVRTNGTGAEGAAQKSHDGPEETLASANDTVASSTSGVDVLASQAEPESAAAEPRENSTGTVASVASGVDAPAEPSQKQLERPASEPQANSSTTTAAGSKPKEAVTASSSVADSEEAESSQGLSKEASETAGEATAHASTPCIEDNTAYVPLDMPSHDMSYESSAEACQMRCAAITGCETFTFFQVDKSCHVQDGNALRLDSLGGLAGRTGCYAVVFRKL